MGRGKLASLSFILFASLAATGCNSGSSSSSPAVASNAAAGSITSTATLAISPTSWTLASQGTYTFSASGGTAPYSFYSNAGSMGISTGVFTAPVNNTSANMTVQIAVTDSGGSTPAYASVMVQPAGTVVTAATITVSQSPSTAYTGGNPVTFTASGGTAPYTFTKTSGNGTLSGNVYTTSSVAETADFTVHDSAVPENSATFTLVVAEAVVSSEPLNQTVYVWTDSQLGMTFDNNQPGAVNPDLVFFETGSNIASTSSLGAGDSSCHVSHLAEVQSPCVVHLPLGNIVSSAWGSTTYEGQIYVAGPTDSALYNFCIDPANTTSAFLIWVAGSTGEATWKFKSMAYTSSTNQLLGGRTIEASYIPVGTPGWTSVTIINANYTSNTSCSDDSGYSATTFVQASAP